MERTYRDLYNAEARAVMSLLMNWRLDAGLRSWDNERMEALREAGHDLFREWCRTHETRPNTLTERDSQ